jgi:hypothetical protein
MIGHLDGGDGHHKGRMICAMPDPREIPVSPFFHQIDQVGVYHSICRVCYQTVAMDSRVSKLVKGEEEHQCWGTPQLDLDHVQADA